MSLSSPLPSGLWPGRTPEDVEGVAEAGKARRGEDRLEGWRRRHHTDRNSHP